MKTISISELHEHTGEWVHAAATHDRIVVIESGQPIAVILPHLAAADSSPTMAEKLKNRKLLPDYAKLMGTLHGGTDSTAIVSDDRDRE